MACKTLSLSQVFSSLIIMCFGGFSFYLLLCSSPPAHPHLDLLTSLATCIVSIKFRKYLGISCKFFPPVSLWDSNYTFVMVLDVPQLIGLYSFFLSGPLDSFYCCVFTVPNAFICQVNLLLIPPSVFFISDILFIKYESLIWVF